MCNRAVFLENDSFDRLLVGRVGQSLTHLEVVKRLFFGVYRDIDNVCHKLAFGLELLVGKDSVNVCRLNHIGKVDVPRFELDIAHCAFRDDFDGNCSCERLAAVVFLKSFENDIVILHPFFQLHSACAHRVYAKLITVFAYSLFADD